MFLININIVLILIVASVVDCLNSGGYYVIHMPMEPRTHVSKPAKQFNVYWNVPTMQCKSKRIPFTNLFEDFGIIQNKNDSFRGEKISILYDPGVFPALLKNESSGKFVFRNGGVPQEGDLARHLEEFGRVLNESIPDENFNGVGIIDFESWRPVYRQNFGVLSPYKDISYEIEQSRHRFWTKNMLTAEATRRFEHSAINYMDLTLKMAKDMRPLAKWGYYAYPYCFNMAGNHMNEKCANNVPEENDRISWLWSGSTALYPSLYMSKDLNSDQLAKMMGGRVKEASRLNHKTPILPYFWFKYREGDFLSEKHVKISLETLYKSNASGFIIWGSSNDVNTKAKCLDLYDYVNTVLGPAIAKYTKKNNRVGVLNEEDVSNNINNSDDIKLNNTNSEPDPEFHWVPPENYTQDIISYVANEFGNKTVNKNVTTNNVTHPSVAYLQNAKENNVIDLLIKFLFKNMDKQDDIIDINLDNSEIVSTLNPSEIDISNDESSTIYNIIENENEITTESANKAHLETSENYVNSISDTTTESLTTNDIESITDDNVDLYDTTQYFITTEDSYSITTTENPYYTTKEEIDTEPNNEFKRISNESTTIITNIETTTNSETTTENNYYTIIEDIVKDRPNNDNFLNKFNYESTNIVNVVDVEATTNLKETTYINNDKDVAYNADEITDKYNNLMKTSENINSEENTELYLPTTESFFKELTTQISNNEDIKIRHSKNRRKGFTILNEKERFQKINDAIDTNLNFNINKETVTENRYMSKNIKKGFTQHNKTRLDASYKLEQFNKEINTEDLNTNKDVLTKNIELSKNIKKGIPQPNKKIDNSEDLNSSKIEEQMALESIELSKNVKKGLSLNDKILKGLYSNVVKEPIAMEFTTTDKVIIYDVIQN